MKLDHVEKKYWTLALADDIEFAVTKDGLLCMLEVKDVQVILDEHYIFDEEIESYGGWWWNESKDRAIAELQGNGKVTVNPQFMKHFKTVVWE